MGDREDKKSGTNATIRCQDLFRKIYDNEKHLVYLGLHNLTTAGQIYLIAVCIFILLHSNRVSIRIKLYRNELWNQK